MVSKLRELLSQDRSKNCVNVFEEYVGQFWGIQGTRPYMRARFFLVDKLLQIKNFDAVKVAFDHTMDMLRLNRSDNLGLRFIAPSLFLRLGNDQQCPISSNGMRLPVAETITIGEI